jgi:hypothetical protein
VNSGSTPGSGTRAQGSVATWAPFPAAQKPKSMNARSNTSNDMAELVCKTEQYYLLAGRPKTMNQGKL